MVISCSNKSKNQVTHNSQSNQKQLIDANRILIKKDRQKIKGYIKRQNWKMTETNTGLWYQILKEGSGDSIVEGDQISLQYKLTLLDGTECYNSEKDGLKSFEVGRGNVESGLQQGVLLLKEGSKAKFILPPHLAHGLTGDDFCIPARAIIIYEIEVIPTNN
jgi:FKBP-type peptidyl-prolyl cis-trans isomerase FkpA